jgi:hypothetical protein
LLKHDLVASFDNVFPEDLFQEMIREAHNCADHAERSNEGFMHGKKQTFFVDLSPDGTLKDHRPRFALERAIELLVKMDYPTPEERGEIYGAEWWVQRRGSDENIGFHYDKDEAAASLDSLLKCPTEGTITYMTDNGGPTVLLNRTTPQGNDPDPFLVTWAGLSYPKVNRHLLFRGNLAHGVAGSLSQSKEARITFLVNYWQYKPIEPNCIHVDKNLMRDLGLDKPKESVLDRGTTSELKKTELVNMEFEGKEVQHVGITLRDEDQWYIELPKDLPPSLYNITWRPEQVANLVQHLDIDSWSERALEDLWESREPKLLFFTPKQGRKTTDSWLGTKAQKKFEKLASAAFPLVSQYLKRFVFLIVDPATSSDVLEAFGLAKKELPTIGIHNTADEADDKYLLEGELTAESARKFVADYFEGELTKLAEEEDAEGGEEL